jgi:hypothetical protein
MDETLVTLSVLVLPFDGSVFWAHTDWSGLKVSLSEARVMVDRRKVEALSGTLALSRAGLISTMRISSLKMARGSMVVTTSKACARGAR